MKKLLLFLICVFNASFAQADTYTIYISYINHDYYSAGSGFDNSEYIIKTWGCYQYATNERVTLNLNTYNAKITFRSGSTCNVEAIYGKIFN